MYGTLESVLEFGAKGETMNSIGLSAASPDNPHAFTCVFYC